MLNKKFITCEIKFGNHLNQWKLKQNTRLYTPGHFPHSFLSSHPLAYPTDAGLVGEDARVILQKHGWLSAKIPKLK